MRNENISAMQMSVCDVALKYGHQGWSIFPVYEVRHGKCACGDESCSSPGKHPRIKNWKEHASHDLKQISLWWKKWPLANIGLVTGVCSNTLVLDVDPRHEGDRSLALLEEKYGPLSNAGKVYTGGGGFHYYFKTKDLFRNKAGFLPGLDIRGEGGYVVAPPSQHISGKAYEWASDFQKELFPELPRWLTEVLEGKSKKTIMAVKASASEEIPSGGRNQALTSIAGALRRANMDEEHILSTLIQINEKRCDPPLSLGEVTRIAKSVCRYPAYSGEREDENWEAPKKLPDPVPRVPQLSESLIPSKLKSWVLDISERMQVVPEFVLAPALVAISTVIGRKIGVYPKQADDWFVVPNLWGALVARPGYFKSPTIAEALRPLEDLVDSAHQNFAQERSSWESESQIYLAKQESIKEKIRRAAKDGNSAEMDLLKKEFENLENEIEKYQSKEKRYKTNDATVEKIAHLLKDNPNGLLILRDELYGWIRTLDKAGREGDREFYLEAWNGVGSYTVDRIGRGTNHIPALCLSILGGIQPGKLKSYVTDAINGGSGDDGLLQRFQLMVYPETQASWHNVDRPPNFKAREEVTEIFRRLDAIPSPDPKSVIPGLRFSQEAQTLFNDWRKNLEIRLRNQSLDCDAFESHLSKYRSLMPSLALLFALIESGDPQEISLENAQLAAKWCDFLEEHAKKVYSVVIQADLHASRALADKILKKEIQDGEKVRSVARRHWSKLKTLEAVTHALEELEGYGWVRVENHRVRGGGSRIIRLNPLLFQDNKNSKEGKHEI